MTAVRTTIALQLLQRIAAASLGGYALAIAFSVCLSYVLTPPRADSVMIGLLVSFVVYAAVILWAFADRSVVRVWAGLALATFAFSLTGWLAGPSPTP